nr:MAG TPA: hypothetical protein [Caudoviricetes sp.]
MAAIVSAWQFQRAIIVVSKKGRKLLLFLFIGLKKDW